MAYTVQSSSSAADQPPNTGGGPRITFLDSRTPKSPYLVIGAYGGNNNIESGSRPLIIVANGGIIIQGLQPAPPGANTVDLVVDRDTGQIYRQS